MSAVIRLFQKYVRNTKKKALVNSAKTLLCYLPVNLIPVFGSVHRNASINTRVLKHLYDKRPAQEFDFMLEHLKTVLKYPTHVYKNKQGKRGQYCFIKSINGTICLCSIELCNKADHKPQWEVVTFFTITQEYLNGYELLWKRKDDDSFIVMRSNQRKPLSERTPQ